MSTSLRIGIIVGSTRPGRIGPVVAEWVLEKARELSDAEFEIVDLADAELPLLDEAVPASAGQYANAHTRAFADRIAPLDGFIFITPEYNHAPSSALFNALSYLSAEWNDKAAGIIAYGYSAAGARAADMLRPVLGELQIADVRQQVLFSLPTDVVDGEFAPASQHLVNLQIQLGQLERWAGALRGVRADKALAQA